MQAVTERPSLMEQDFGAMSDGRSIRQIANKQMHFNLRRCNGNASLGGSLEKYETNGWIGITGVFFMGFVVEDFTKASHILWTDELNELKPKTLYSLFNADT